MSKKQIANGIAGLILLLPSIALLLVLSWFVITGVNLLPGSGGLRWAALLALTVASLIIGFVFIDVDD